jgi:PAS domain S-box-containing protein
LSTPAPNVGSLVVLLSEIGTILVQTNSFPDSLQHCARSLITHLDAALVRIWTYNPVSYILELQTSEGLYTHLDGPHARIAVGSLKIGLIAEERRAHLTNDLANDSRIGDLGWVKRERLVSFAGFPLLVDDKLVGVLGLFARHPLPPETLRALESVCTSIAVRIERKHAEANLRKSEERFRTTFAAAPIGMVLTTMDGLLIETNEAYRKIVGYSVEELRNTVFLDLSHPDDLPRNRVLFEQLLRGEITSYTIEKRYLCKSGRFTWVRATAALQRDAQGIPQDVIGLVEDISEHKRAQDELARSNDELSRFAHVAAHDLQSPLRTMKIYIELIERRLHGQLEESTAQWMHIVLNGMSRMERLIERLLHYAGLGNDQPEHLPVSMPNTFAAAISNLRELIVETGAEVTCIDALPVVLGDPVQLLQLVQNLIANGIKYRNPNAAPVIQMSAHRSDQFWQFCISDNGLGIAPQHHEEVFALLKRLHGDDVPGTGMGLAICKKIVDRHRGRIWVESQHGGGSKFLFTLPA